MKEVKRVVSTGLWDDKLVSSRFSPEDKYFWLYLLTNPYTTQLGIYYLPIPKACLDLGYSKETILTLLDRFEKVYEIIKYNPETSEVAIKNYLRHSIVKGGKPVLDCLIKESKDVSDKTLIEFVKSNLNEVSDTEELNKTVIEFLKEDTNISNRMTMTMNESSDLYNLDVTFDLEQAFETLFALYPKKTGFVPAKYSFLDMMVHLVDDEARKGSCYELYEAIKLYLADYNNNNPNDVNHQYIPKFGDWLKNEAPYWQREYLKKKDA